METESCRWPACGLRVVAGPPEKLGMLNLPAAMSRPCGFVLSGNQGLRLTGLAVGIYSESTLSLFYAVSFSCFLFKTSVETSSKTCINLSINLYIFNHLPTDMATAAVPFTNENLMEAIRKYPAIYDKSCTGYRNKTVKGNAWKKVSFPKYFYQPSQL
jgi:hypothetical protein